MKVRRGRPKTGRVPKSAAERAREYRKRQTARMLTLTEAAQMADWAEYLTNLAADDPQRAYITGVLSRPMLLARAADVLAEQAELRNSPSRCRREISRLRRRIAQLIKENQRLKSGRMN